MAEELEITALPKKTRYCDGEAIDLSGLALSLDGRDVTDEASLEFTPDVAGWPRGRRRVYVKACAGGSDAVFELRRRRSPAFFAVIALLLAAAALGIAFWRASYDPDALQTGSRVEAQGDMGDMEAQAMLDARAEESLMLVNIASAPVLRADGRVRVAFLVEDRTGAFPQRLVLMQDGRAIYKSGTVLPGYAIEWADADGARTGPVTAMIHRVDADTGSDVGSPVAVELEITDEG